MASFYTEVEVTQMTEDVKCPAQYHTENLYQREVSFPSTHQKDSKFLPMQRSHSHKGSGQNQHSAYKSSEASQHQGPMSFTYIT